MTTVNLPHSLDPISISQFSLDLHALPEAEEYIFDFGERRHFPPFSMLLLSSVLRHFRDERPNSRRRATNHDQHSYPAYMGFYRSFGLQHGNPPGGAAGTENCIPITDIDVPSIRLQARESFREVGDLVEEKASQLAHMLTQNARGPLADTLTYSIREIMRNVVEHSRSEKIHICAQYWPTKNEVEVGIADDGIGVHAALTSNPAHHGLDEKEAIEFALMPGISGNPNAGRGHNVWNNSGYGLYMTSRICRNGGCFLISSGGHGLQLDQNGKTNFETKFKGTAIRLFLNTSNLGDLAGRLRAFADEGREAARTLDGANVNRASTASQMLRRDFQNA